MDTEFHYYVMYLVAARAGFEPGQASILAYSSQHVDDNCVRLVVGEGTPEFYRNYISQTMNILKPKQNLFRIYPLFHFLPGDPNSATAKRRDGTMHVLNTTPNSPNAHQMIEVALATDDLYRIGIACHTLADTWAHQNFVGYFTSFNGMSGVLDTVTPDIGHANAFHKPDWPGCVWTDPRLLGDERQRIENNDRFLEAAGVLFDELQGYLLRTRGVARSPADRAALLTDLEAAIGEQDNKHEYADSRIARYCALGQRPEYGEEAIEPYDEARWIKEALETEDGWFDNFKDWLDGVFGGSETFEWKDPQTHRDTHWYRFQQAVKAHQHDTWKLLEHDTFGELDLEYL